MNNATPPQEILLDDLERIIPFNAKIFLGSGCSEPYYITSYLKEKQWFGKTVQIFHILSTIQNQFFSANLIQEKFTDILVGPNLWTLKPKECTNSQIIEYIPISLANYAKKFCSRFYQFDLAIIQVSQPDAFGYCSLGINVDLNKICISCAKILIAQINPNMPKTTAHSLIPISKFKYIISHTSPLIEIVSSASTPEELKIGKFLSNLVENDSTLMLGPGNLPKQVLFHIDQKKNLAYYGGYIPDEIINPIQSGIINCNRNFYQSILTSSAIGTRKLYNFINLNPKIEFHDSTFIHKIENIAKNHKPIAIYEAMKISLTGQINTEGCSTTFSKGIGGLPEFFIGSSIAKWGKSVICLRSTSSDELFSNIVPEFSEFDNVSISRADVRYVVTEYGIAYLHGKSIRERCLQLIGISHPKFRKELLLKAKHLNLIYQDQMLPMNQDGVVIVYPEKYEREYYTSKQQQILFRPIKSTDERVLQDLLYRMNEQDRIFRFFTPRLIFPHKETQISVNVDYETIFALVGVIGDEMHQEIVAKSIFILDQNLNQAKISFIVREDYRHQGLTHYMLNFLSEIAQELGIHGFYGEVLSDNKPMLEVLHSIPYHVVFIEKGAWIEFKFNFDSPKINKIVPILNTQNSKQKL